MKIGERIRGLYVSDGVSQADLARHCGLEPYEVSRIVTGRRRPQLHQLQAIATAEEKTLEELVTGTDAEHMLGQEPKLVSRSELEEVLQRALKAEELTWTLEAEKKALATELEASQKQAREAKARVIEVEGQVMMMKAQLEVAEVDAGSDRMRALLLEAKHDAVVRELEELRERFSESLAIYAEIRQSYENLNGQYLRLWEEYESIARENNVEGFEQRMSKFVTDDVAGMLKMAFGVR